ncbi:hypothetical protein FNL56_21485 [Tardiphaga sp. vice304]|uniref:gpW family head-tail joining protein n=1 Tax=Tardiphaga sp. vice304 TaxID=2592817 RepID=UPI00116363BE|nr:gpW family head-tail joining protein [Tardiphaga sp. vice304]QDM28396.1 hypothetical protein FNL56_21485 [Tardiphaga sp. vice304]
MTNPCNPVATPPPNIDNPCAYLGQLRAALYTLMAGQARAEIRFGDQTLRYHQTNVAELRLEVQRLEHMCNGDGTVNNRGRAMGTPRRPAGSLGFPHNRYR